MSATHSSILCFNPYARWSLHSARQSAILHGLKVRGCTTQYVVCDSLMTECDMYQPAKGPGYVRNAMSCTQCQAGTAAILAKFGHSPTWLGQWIPPSAQSDAQTWAKKMDGDQLHTAVKEDWEIGNWVRSSVHSHFRASTLDLDNPEVNAVYRRYLASGVVMAQGLDEMFRTEKPDALLLFNGRMAPTRIALEIAQRHGVRTITEERGFTPGHLRLVENTHCLDAEPFYRLWNAWRDVPLTNEEINTLAATLSAHRQGQNFEMSLFATPVSGTKSIMESLGLDADRPIITAYTSATDESAVQEQARGSLRDQADWLQQTADLAARRPDIQFVIRFHPNTAGKRALGTNATEAALQKSLSESASDNLFVVPSDSDISSFDLMAVSTAGMVWHSTVGLEMAALGKQVLRLGAYWFRDADFMDTVKSADDFEHAVDRILTPQSEQDHSDKTVQAWRCAMCWFYRQSIDFPLVTQPDWARGAFTFDTVDALAPGQDSSLDRVCSILMDGAPIHDLPDERSSDLVASERKVILDHVNRIAS